MQDAATYINPCELTMQAPQKERNIHQSKSWYTKNISYPRFYLKGESNVMYWFMTELYLNQWAQCNAAQYDIWSKAWCISAVHLSSPLCKTLCKCHSVNRVKENVLNLEPFRGWLQSPAQWHPPLCHPAAWDDEWDDIMASNCSRYMW